MKRRSLRVATTLLIGTLTFFAAGRLVWHLSVGPPTNEGQTIRDGSAPPEDLNPYDDVRGNR